MTLDENLDREISQKLTVEVAEEPEALTLSVKSPDEVETVIKTPIINPHEAQPPYELKRPVFFVGFMVAGKTSVSRNLARACGIPTIDLDAYIERREGKAINQIFAEVGDAGFRLIETDVLREFAEGEPMLVSCGGGIVLREENRDIIRKDGCCVYLQVTAEEAARRIGDVSTRPNFKDLDTARTTIANRLPMYEDVANISVDTVGKSINAVANEVRIALEEAGVLCQVQG